MKSIISISVGFGLLINHAFGSAADLMEGAVGEVEATVSFYGAELDNSVVKVELALSAFGSTPNSLNFQELKATFDMLEKLYNAFDSSKQQAEKTRSMLNAIPTTSRSCRATG